MVDRRISVDGEPVFIHTGGVAFEPGRRTVVLLHGAGMDHTTWRFQTRSLAHHGMAVAAPDFPDHGRSGGKAFESIEDMGSWVQRLLAALGAGPAIVVGHSMGSLVALEAARIGDSVAGLVLVGTSGAMGVHPDLLQAAASDLPLAARMVTGWSFGGHGVWGGHPQPGTWLRATGSRVIEASRPGVLAADLSSCAAFPGLQAASDVRRPALVLVGSDDRMTPPEAARELAGCLPAGRFELVDSAGHMLPAERPRLVLDRVLSFARSVLG